MAHGMEGHGTCSLDLKWLLCSSWATQPDSLEEILTHCWSLSAVKASVTRLDKPSVAAGLVDIVEQLVLHHINSSNTSLNTWMEAKVEWLTSEGQRLQIGSFVHSCIVKRLSMNNPLLEAGLWPEGVSAGAELGVKNRLDIEASGQLCHDEDRDQTRRPASTSENYWGNKHGRNIVFRIRICWMWEVSLLGILYFLNCKFQDFCFRLCEIMRPRSLSWSVKP